MQIIRISDIHHPRFGEVWHLYQNSFPLCEQRTLDHQITAFKADRFHLDVYLDGETLVGFIGYWDFDDYLYIEHYAINSDLRGSGRALDLKVTDLLMDYLSGHRPLPVDTAMRVSIRPVQ